MASAGQMYKLKEITKVQNSKEMVDVVLSRTQRKTPTEVHPQFKIQRIRQFYMRKIKYAQTTFNEKLTGLLEQFPRIDDIHPFYADLCNVLYDRDHYKLALGQVHAVRGIVDSIGKDYVRLLKFADTMYKCKCLKRAGLGRMCTAVLKLKQSLAYLEEVRQHMSRLPAINPATRTLLLTGYPNVGKSSFMNIITNANVDVQPYAFTTKSLFVGHLDYNYVRWQCIDTPGILDHPLEQRNTIEMTAITALAHIKATVLFVIDISENCGWTIKQQIDLFMSIKPLFKGKPLLVVLNKTDLKPRSELKPSDRKLIDGLPQAIDDTGSTVEILETSCATQIGVDDAKTKACELLLQQRVGPKAKSAKAADVEGRMHITTVKPRSDRPAMRPPNAKAAQRKAYEGDESDDDMNAHKMLREEAVGERLLSDQGGGAGVYSSDLRKYFDLRKEEHKYDIIPEFMDGKNIADFIDPDIDAKLAELEKEEELLLAASADQFDDEEEKKWEDTKVLLAQLKHKREQRKLENRLDKSKNHVPIPRRRQRALSAAQDALEAVGKPAEVAEAIAQRGRKRKRSLSAAPSAREPSEGALDARGRSKSRGTSVGRKGDLQGLPNEGDRAKSESMKRAKQRKMQRESRKGEADRSIKDRRPKHLFSGKRPGLGTKDWR